MYKEHFAIERPLFMDGIARDTDVYLWPSAQLTATNLKIAFGTRDSITVLGGPAGVGKTTIAAYAVRAAATRLALGWLGTPPLTPHELLEQLLTEFDFSPYKSSRVERMQTWRQFLSEMSITDTRVCVLVENAQDYAPEILRSLGALTGADPSGCPGANVVLMSTLPARELLADPGLEAIKQRLRLSARLEPCTPEEMDAYLRRRCTRAGTEYGKVFAPGTAALLQHYSSGLLRVANNVCETALCVAAARNEPLVHPELLTQVAVGLFGMEPAPAEASEAAGRPTDVAAPKAPMDAHPIVGERAAATAAMMAAEASLEPADDFGEGAAEVVNLPVLTDTVEDDEEGDPGGLERDLGIEGAATRRREAQAALGRAKALEEISNSMAETLFGEAELGELRATLAVAAITDDDDEHGDDLELSPGDDAAPPRQRSQML